MKLRELLQHEIWSKETSRRILRPIRRILKYTAIVLGALGVLIAIAYGIERHWLTNGERTSGRIAFTKVEELEKLIDCNCDQFEAADGDAKAAVAAAEKKGRTLRDGSVAAYLSVYLMEIEQMQMDDLREAKLKLLMQERNSQWHSNPQLENESRSLQFKIFGDLRSVLHKELD
jgi:hypothetical protein